MKQSLMIIDDDERLTTVLARRFVATEQFSVVTFSQASLALESEAKPYFAVLLDMMIGDELGLEFIEAINQRFSPTHLIVMTGYASIATTVAAMKRGATDYLAKPTSFHELLNKLRPPDAEQVSLERPKPLTAAQAEWEHIQRILEEHDGNISRTADALGMHRRSLQRKLQKLSPTKS